jgi:hypothetical protein
LCNSRLRTTPTQNLWHAMADSADSLLPQAHDMGATGLMLEWRPGYGPLTGMWSSTFDILSLYDWEPGLAKRGADRKASLRSRSAFESLCQRANDLGLSTFLMGAELNLTEEMRKARPELMDPDGYSLYAFCAHRFEDILQACPHLTGILLYLEEGNIVIQYLPGDRPAVERMRLLIEGIVEVCEKLDTKLIVTTFALMPHQAKAVTDALKEIPPSPGLMVHNYACPGDWGRIALKNPAVGNCGSHPEFVAFDYCGEIWGQSVVPFVQARLMAERVAYARERGARIAGLTGYVTWADLEGELVYEGRALGSVNEANVHVARRIAESGELEPEEFVREWVVATYGPDIADALTPILLRQQDSHLAAWQLLGFWFMEWPKSRMPDLNWFEYSLHWESLAIWDESQRESERLLWEPTREFVQQRVLPEKQRAVSEAELDLNDLERLVGESTNPKLQELLMYFRREMMMNRALRHYTAAYFYAKLHTAGDSQAEADAKGEFTELLRIAEVLEANPDPGFWILEPSRVRLVVREIEEVLKTGKWPAEKSIREWDLQMEAWGYEAARPSLKKAP